MQQADYQQPSGGVWAWLAKRRLYARTTHGLRCKHRGVDAVHGSAQVRREVAAEVPGAFIPPIPNWDSNVITPGTVFMAKLAASLREYLCRRLSTHPHWQHIQARAGASPCTQLSSCAGLVALHGVCVPGCTAWCVRAWLHCMTCARMCTDLRRTHSPSGIDTNLCRSPRACQHVPR